MLQTYLPDFLTAVPPVPVSVRGYHCRSLAVAAVSLCPCIACSSRYLCCRCPWGDCPSGRWQGAV